MNQAVDIGHRRELFVDHLLIDQMHGVSLKLHEPTPSGIAFQIDRPWEGPANGPRTVMRHDGRFLMYYRAMTLAPDDRNGPLCVAISEDGVSWLKPNLGLVERGGSPGTNIVADELGQAIAGQVWLDTRPGVARDEQIKIMYSETLSGEIHTPLKDPKGPKRLVLLGSGDGFSFRRLDPQPTIVSTLRNCFDGGNTMFWSEAEQQYLLYYRWLDAEWSEGGRRSVARTTSRDFLTWSDPVPMTYGDTPREQLYTNNTQPYFRAPHIYVAPAARFMQGRSVLTEVQVKEIGLHDAHGYSYDKDCSDCVLLTSRAGSTQYDRTFMEAWIRPGLGLSNWTSRTNYPVTGILPAGTEEMMLFVARHYMQDSWHLERLLLRTDGFISVNAGWSGGEMVTRPLLFAGAELSINYRTSAAGCMRVAIEDTEGNPILGYELSACVDIIGDEVERVVAWKHGADVSALAGQPVRLRFSLKDADLYSLQFQ